MKHHSQGAMADRFRRLIAYDPLAGLHHKKREAGGRVNLASHIAEQSKTVNTNPTDGQKEAGNYRKGHVKVHGLDISIENPRGSFRSGVADGKPWKSRLPAHYGYIRKTEGGDGQHVDCYIGPHLKSPHVFVIDQHELGSKRWDEHKAFIGFGSKTQAKEAYHRAFSDGRGKDRIGHIETMTVDEFKDWLKDGNTTAPIKNRADGGRVHMADGGIPAFDQSRGPDAAGPPPFDASRGSDEPDRGGLNAAWQGAKAGATFNFSDELLGARAAAPKVAGHEIPDFVGPVPAKTIAGMGRLAYEHFVPPADASTSGNAAYEQARDEERKSQEIAKAQHPYLHMAGEIAGSIPSMAALPEAGFAARGAQTAGRLAKFGRTAADAAVTGSEYGGLSGLGEGEGTADRAVKSAEGIVGGIVGGGAAHVVGSGVGALAERYLGPAVRTAHGWVDREGEASRRVASALKSDSEMIATGQAKGMTLQQWAAARQNGEPVTLADLGAGRTQALLRSAANTSPEGRALLEKVLDERFLNQGERVAGTVRKAIPGVQADARKTGDQLVAEYDAGRVPAYKAAYAAGDRPLMSPAMERMMSSDTFVAAMKRAISTGKDRDVAEGLGGFNPMVNVTPDGRIVFNKGANGAPTYPNLQYWDQVKRELDSVANQAKRSGDTSSSAGALAKLLRGELDKQVPQYQGARGIAEKYFGEDNALEAGRKLAGKQMDPEEVKQILRGMKPDERALFQEGYASDLANRVIGNMSDTTNLTAGRGVFKSPNERKMAAAIFGPGGMAQLQARMHLETIMDGARKAMGNSTTARQLIEAGLAGGAGGLIGGASSGWDPMKMAEGASTMAGVRVGASRLLTNEMKVGAKHLIGKVDAKTARRVAELLTSDDPRLLRQGYQMAAKSSAIMGGLRDTANRVALAGQNTAIPKFRIDTTGWGVPRLQGPVPAGADDEKNRSKGPIQ